MPVVQTSGVNFAAVGGWAGHARDLDVEMRNMIDVDRITSNDINAILEFYGVEAARASIVSEIRSVFQVYGITVDPRHLSLIADYMTHEGGYKPLNRTGMETSGSPLHKMSFETTTHFMTQAALMGDVDTLASPSASIVLGKRVKCGTGAFELRAQLPSLDRREVLPAKVQESGKKESGKKESGKKESGKKESGKRGSGKKGSGKKGSDMMSEAKGGTPAR